jgi:hypothetical protein
MYFLDSILVIVKFRFIDTRTSDSARRTERVEPIRCNHVRRNEAAFSVRLLSDSARWWGCIIHGGT